MVNMSNVYMINILTAHHYIVMITLPRLVPGLSRYGLEAGIKQVFQFQALVAVKLNLLAA
jgi:hypothetical protein